jgi:hypothetical protein
MRVDHDGQEARMNIVVLLLIVLLVVVLVGGVRGRRSRL